MHRLMHRVIALVALVALLTAGCGPAATPTPAKAPVTPTKRATTPVATAKPSTPGVYYLYWKDNPTMKVAIIGGSHKSVPVDDNQLANWYLAGTACVAEAGTKAYRGSTSGPMFSVGVEVAEGVCRGFLGWVPLEEWQTTAP